MRMALVASLWLSSIASADPSEATATLDALWPKRDDPAAANELDGAVRQALLAHGGDYGVLWRAARYKWWLADGATDSAMKKKLGRESWELGDRASKQNPDGVEGCFYAAIGMGAYSQAAGILTALGQGLESKYNERIDRALAIDPWFDRAGPTVAKGRYHFELPWPKRDLKKSLELLRKALERFPENLRARLYLAEALLKDDAPEPAREAVRKVADGQVDYDPPEARRIQAMARPVQQAIEEELR